MMNNRYTRRYNGNEALELLFDKSENALHSNGNEMEGLEDYPNVLNSTAVVDFNINEDDLRTIDSALFFSITEHVGGDDQEYGEIELPVQYTDNVRHENEST